MSKLDKAAVETEVKAVSTAVKDSLKSEDVYAIVDELKRLVAELQAFWIEYPTP